MKCQECMDFLTEYIDGRLPDSDTARVIAHLKDCADCRGLEAELRATVALVGSLERRAVPESLADAISSKLERRMLLAEERPPKRKFILTPLRLAGVGAAVAAALLVAVYLRAPQQVPVVSGQPVDSAGDLLVSDGPSDTAQAPAGAARKKADANGLALDGAASAEENARSFKDSSGGTRAAQLSSQPASPGKPDGTKGIDKKSASLYRERVGAGDAPAVKDAGDSEGRTEMVREAVVNTHDYDANRANEVAGGSVKAAEVKVGAEVASWSVVVPTASASGGMTAQDSSSPAGTASAQGAESARLMELGGKLKSEGAPTDDMKKAEEQKNVAEMTFYFTGKSSAAARQLLSLFPDGRDKGFSDTSPEAIKSAAAARGITVVELTDDRAVFEFTADAERIRTVTGELSATAGLSPAGAYSEKWPVEEKKEKALNQPETETPNGRMRPSASGEKLPATFTYRIIFARRPKEVQPAATTGRK